MLKIITLLFHLALLVYLAPESSNIYTSILEYLRVDDLVTVGILAAPVNVLKKGAISRNSDMTRACGAANPQQRIARWMVKLKLSTAGERH